MSKPINPTAIGGFLLAGLALLVTALLVFGGGQFFKPKVRWVVYFDSSLNGLNVGAPVKVQGVQVGQVKDIVLQMDLKHNRLMKPVIIEIEPGALVNPTGEPLQAVINDDERHHILQRLIDAGLRARLEVQSILTGLLYVDLDFNPSYPPTLSGLSYEHIPEVPSIPSATDEIKNAVENVVRRIGNMPLEKMVKDLSDTLADIKTIVASNETKESREALAGSLLEARKLLTEINHQLPPLVKEMSKAVKSAESTMTDAGQTVREAGTMVNELRAETRPLVADTRQSLQKATEMLEQGKAAMANIADTTAEDSTLQQTLVELKDAAHSVQLLSDYLERHPDSIIFGKSK